MCAGAAIGADRDQGQSAVVGIRGAIDDSVEIQSNVSVYASATPEDDAIRGPCMVFNSVCNPRSAVSREHEYRDTLVRRGATLGANCTVVCG